MADNSSKKGRFTKYSNKIGLFSNSTHGFVNNAPDVVLNFPFKDSVLEGGMSKEDVERDERFLHQEIDRADIDTLEDPKVLTNFKHIDTAGERQLTASDPIEFFDTEGNLKQNLLIKGNNLLALYSLREKLAGKVKLIYIDPPYNTGNDGFRYNDRFNHSAWLVFMKNRLEIAKELLAEDGFLFVQCDYRENSYLRVLLDEIFGRNNLVNEISWRKYGGVKNQASKQLTTQQETIYWYSKSEEYEFNKLYNPLSAAYVAAEYKYTDENGRIYAKLRGRGYQGDVKTTKIKYLDENPGSPITSLWSEDGLQLNTSSAEKLGDFVGQKPEALLERIISLTTSNNDLVLDFCLGTATTAAVAHKMGRRWVGIEQMDYIDTVAKKRLKKVILGEQSGISKSVEWKGGGSFVYFELKQYNQEFIDRIMAANSMGALDEVYADMAKNAFLKFWFDKKDFERDEKFRSLSLNERKDKLVYVLDENQLYLNYPDMDDRKHRVSPDEKALTNRFYGSNEQNSEI